MFEKPDAFLLLHHHSLTCAGTDAFCSNPLDGLQPGAGQQLGSRTAHFCSALVLGQQSWDPEAAASPTPTVPLGFSLISAVVVTTQEWK